MEDVKNCAGKLACRVDRKMQVVEIVQKGVVTVICFLPDNQIKVESGSTPELWSLVTISCSSIA